MRCCIVIDNCNHEFLTITVAQSLPGVAVIQALEAIIARTALVLVARQRERASRSRLRRVGRKPWHRSRLHQARKSIQNAWIENVNGRLRDERVNQHYCLSLLNARFHIEGWRQHYNTDRPHEACASLTPTQIARTFDAATSPGIPVSD